MTKGGCWKGCLLAVLIFLGLVVWSLIPRSNPWKQYGIRFEIDTGHMSDTYQVVEFYYRTDGIEQFGLFVSGGLLNLEFKDVDGDGFPEGVITSDVEKGAAIQVFLRRENCGIQGTQTQPSHRPR